jgi:hypothetical protein
MSIAITGQYVFRGKVEKDSVPVGIIYPDTSRGKVFASAPSESFTPQELCEIAEFVKTKFSHVLVGRLADCVRRFVIQRSCLFDPAR